MIFRIIIVIAAAAVVTTLVVGRNTRNGNAPRILRIVAQALTVATVAALIVLRPVDTFQFTSNSAATEWFLMGVPLAAAALPSLGSGNVLLWVAAVIITGWAFVLGLGPGLYMLPAGLCMLAAAAIQPWASARDRE